MFTGIIEEIGTIHCMADQKDIRQYQIQTSNKFMQDVRQGDSIAVNGVCLTAYDIQESAFNVDVSQETQKCTNFGVSLRERKVNLERSVTPTTRLGGHFVTGHVDGLGELVKREDNENETVLWIQIPAELVKYVAVKGSICINGVSLTVNETKDDLCCITIIPHTLQNTTFNSIQINDIVNIEIDLIARYVENIIHSKSKQ